eukprot:6068699-Prymnesium_polylepis.1
MCNPPFFDEEEAPRQRGDSVAGSLAAPNEQFTAGGEVGFVGRMVADSTMLRERVLWYTSLVGRKASLPPLLKQLRQVGARHVRTTELAQGRTSRWALAWSFVDGAAPCDEAGGATVGGAKTHACKAATCSKPFRVGPIEPSVVRRRLLELFEALGGVRLEPSESGGDEAPGGQGAPAILARGAVEGGGGGQREQREQQQQQRELHEPRQGKRQRAVDDEVAAGPSSRSTQSAAGALPAVAPVAFGFEVRLHAARPEHCDERGGSQGGEGADGGLWAEVVLVAASGGDAADAAAKEAFWPFAERVRNDVVRDTRRWRRMELGASRAGAAGAKGVG